MNSHHCCPERRALDRRRASRFRSIVEWLVPSAILLVMPKCPACIAAYITIATGLGISFSAATQVRMLILTLCFATLTLLIAKHTTAIISRLRARER
jgi:hypothetical protein